MSKLSDLVLRIKRRLGYPMIKVELDDTNILDNIYYARSRFIKYAAGQATQDVWFTMMLSGGQSTYDMPDGTVEVISYTQNTGIGGGINTLFTVNNMLYNQGYFNGILNTSNYNDGFNLISYQLAMDFIETLQRYTPDEYHYRYHKARNILEIQPTPATGSTLTIDDVTYDSPGFILLHTHMIAESTLSDWEGLDSTDNSLYDINWILDYSTALSKITLGMIRRKFSNFTSLGNQGTSLDGSDLVTEGKEEKKDLEEDLDKKECYLGMPIYRA
jgi:hypothetical protein